MDTLVLGGDGFVGRHLCAELVARGHDVTSLSRYPERGVLPDEVAVRSGNVTRYRSVAGAFEGRDAAVNLPALSPLYQPPEGRSHSDVHVRGTLNVVRACRDHGVETLFQMSALGADENAPAAYFRAKAAAETAVRNADLDWVVFRPAPMFGAAGHFLSFVRTVTTPYVTLLPGGGTTRFQPVWIEDSVPLFAEAIEDDEHLGEIYELGGPEVLTLATVTRRIYRASGTETTPLPVPMALAALGAATVDPLSSVPFGLDQVGALRNDVVTDDNCLDEFGVAPADLTSLPSYLEGRTTDVGETTRGKTAGRRRHVVGGRP